MKNKASHLLLLPVIAVMVMSMCVAGCASRRQAASSVAGQAMQPAVRDWSDIYAPFSMKLSRPMPLSFSGRATMVRDKSIFLSMRMLGIEIAQVYLDSDSVWVVDKFHKVVCAEPTSRLTGSRKLTVADLQDIMLGRRSMELHGVAFDYLDFVTTPVGELPASIEAAGTVGRLKVEASMTWNFDKARFNAGNVAAWTPPGLRRVTASEMIDILRNM